MGDKQAANLRKYVLENAQIINIQSIHKVSRTQKKVIGWESVCVCVSIIPKFQTIKRF